MTGTASRGTFLKKLFIRSRFRRSFPALAGVIASVLFAFCLFSVPISSDNSIYPERAGEVIVYDRADPEAVEHTAEQTAQPEAVSEAPADESQNSQDQKKSSGRYFINKTHIIISCLVAFALAVLIAILQANKKFK